MITIERDRCSGCGSCVRICHEECIELVDGSAGIDQELCSACTQCIAVCPQQALSWDHVPPLPYDESRLPSPEQLDELFKERRTTRYFRGDKIDRTVVEEIIGYGVYAPTNNYALRAIVVDDRETIEELDRIILGFVSRIYNLFFRWSTVFNLIRRITPKADPKDRVKMESTLERGSTFDDPPAAIVFVVGDSRVALSEASAQYALYNMILYAQPRGIGSRLKGTGQIVLDRNRAARERLALKRHEHVLGTLELGYPAVRFRNKVEGKSLPIQWIKT